MHKEKIAKANILCEALPYLKQFNGQTIVIKYGGSIMVDEKLKQSFAEDITLLKYIGLNPVIVHGGGKEITKWMDKVGKKAVFIDGLRVTDAESMEITEMVVTGKVNSEVVSLISHHGGKAVGLSGKDGNLFVGKQIKSKKNKDLGFVGDIEEVDSSLIITLCEKGYIPVISPVGRNKEGQSLNMNADHVAEAIATELKAMKLIYLTDVDGVMIKKKLQNRLTLAQSKGLLKHPEVKGGMIPKLTCAMNAIKGGAERVHIINGTIKHAVVLELFTDVGIGTMISKKEIKEGTL